MRHAPYSVGLRERDEWMLCMTQALTEQVSDLSLRAALIERFAQMADHMVNSNAAAQGYNHAAQSV